MTEVVEYLCKSCKKKYGPIGLHGASVELVGVCKRCKDFRIIPVREGDAERTSCSNCAGEVELFKGTCPNCGSEDMYFRDLAIQIPGEEGWTKYKKK